MIYKLDHIGITVPSLAEAQAHLDALHLRYCPQLEMETGPALREVSIHQPARFQISLHSRSNSIGIELIEYAAVAPPARAIFPWNFTAGGDLSELKIAVRSQVESGPGEGNSGAILTQLSAYETLNAVVVAVENLESEERFWRELRFRKVFSDEALAIFAFRSLVPPSEDRYVLLWKVDRAMKCYTDAEGINEIALLCGSCEASLNSFPQDVFRSSVSAFRVNGNEIELGYLRSPSGALVELFSVKTKPAHHRMSANND